MKALRLLASVGVGLYLLGDPGRAEEAGTNVTTAIWSATISGYVNTTVGWTPHTCDGPCRRLARNSPEYRAIMRIFRHPGLRRDWLDRLFRCPHGITFVPERRVRGGLGPRAGARSPSPQPALPPVTYPPLPVRAPPGTTTISLEANRMISTNRGIVFPPLPPTTLTPISSD
ncbi:MAG: hypothetical protein L0Y58_22920 [Verrucomicrobia subdivision 3 bacterium]|nr:hypothetical protein [Limisphaerales bacterium]